MAHFARLGTGNKVVRVHVVHNNEVPTEQAGIEFLQNLHQTTDVFVQTSYNGSFRKNYAGKGYQYDYVRDAFIAPRPTDIYGILCNSFTLNETTCQWENPVAYPSDGKVYRWNEIKGEWEWINA